MEGMSSQYGSHMAQQGTPLRPARSPPTALRRQRSGLDEGYSGGSEETTSLADSDGTMHVDPSDGEGEGEGEADKERADDTDQSRRHILALPGPERHSAILDLFRALSDMQRQAMAKELVASFVTNDAKFALAAEALDCLPTSFLAAVVDSFNHRLHIDPVESLPPELTEQVFLHLSPTDLLRCSVASKKWRERVLDGKLWKLMFAREGWLPLSDQVEDAVYNEAIRRTAMADVKPHRRKPDSDLDGTGSRKRQRESFEGRAPTTRGAALHESASDWAEQYGAVEVDDDHVMGGLDHAASPEASLSSTRHSTSPSSVVQDLNLAFSPPLQPGLFDASCRTARISWVYLYKHRRRLERNWHSGRYSTFQLPHPDFPDEGHKECVYTIQYSGNWLASGSRDKHIKIWRLDTQRCERTLSGAHTQSVLCLQFDDKEDILVSGGSDTFVVVWRFSTGEIIRKMDQAHEESVLNLRFDHRYLITCSKDKTIKIWNRHEVTINDPIVPAVARRQLAIAGMDPLREFSLLTILNGHNAAVNAIQVFNSQIVSASGDRTIKSWDINTGTCLRTYPGHTKGIACVQYDGRRIVSGSSDNTVRIFDAVTSAEVACLTGHTDLVRTVQARFGDLGDDGAALYASARAIDDSFDEARRNGMDISQGSTRMPRNAGSSNPRDICATGARVPPGGGGSRWSRIVSGSYDETVIIWKKDYEGKWVANRKLHQDEIIQTPRNQRARMQRGHVVAAAGPTHQRGAIAQQPQAQQPAIGHQVPAAALPQQAPATTVHQLALQAQQRAAQPVPAGSPVTTPPAAALAAAQAAHANHANHAGHGLHHRPPREETNRVFKLQFDSRRIVCCSQNHLIVGWDFANGDPDLEEASRFFEETG